MPTLANSPAPVHGRLQRQARHWLLALGCTLPLLLGCAATGPAILPAAGSAPASPMTAGAAAADTLPAAPADLQAHYLALRQAQGPTGRLYQLQPQASQLRIQVYRAGRARRLGHNHVLTAPRFTGYAWLASEDPAASSFALEFPLAELELDRAEVRSALGEAFASPLTAQQISATRENMLGERVLQAAQYPLLRIRSLQVQGEAPHFAALIAVQLHGQERSLWVPLTVQASASGLQVQGALLLLQSDFGIRPFSVLGGLLAVQDPVLVEFSLQGTALP